MSIATQIKRLRDVKQEIKEVVNEDFYKINDETIDKYPELINDTFDEYKSYIPYKHYEGEILSINNDDNKEFRSFTIEGNSKQETRSGKNLLSHNIEKGTRNGITLVVNSDKSITMNGTASETTYFNFNSLTLPSGAYTFSGMVNGSESTYSMLIVYGSNVYRVTTQPITFTLNSETTSGERYIVIQKDTTLSNVTIYPQIEKGSTATSYEPYTGGIPAPNPDYPMEVRTLKGWNLFDKTTITTGKDINTDGTLFASSVSSTSDFIEVEPNTDYIYSGVIDTTFTKRIVIFDKNKVAINSKETKTDTLTITTLSNAKYIRMQVKTNNVDTIQLVKGTTEKPYLPYGAIGVKNTGKNFWTLSSSYHTDTGNNYVLRDTKVSIPKGEYTLSFDCSNDSKVLFSFKNSDGKFQNIFLEGTYSKKVVFEDEKKYAIIYIYKNEATTISNIMISKDGGDYEPYYESITYIDLKGNELLSTDEIKIENGNVKLVKNWGKLICDGTETDWRYMERQQKDGTHYFDRILPRDITSITSNSSSKKGEYCNRLKMGNPYNEKGNLFWFFDMNTAGTFLRIGFDNENLTSVDMFKEWLSNNNLEIYYPLKTPQEIDLGKINLSLLENTNNIELLATLETNLDATTISGDSYNK